MSFDLYRASYAANWRALTIRPERQSEATKTAQRLLAGKARYLIVQQMVGVPWWFVGLCHYRESGFDFDTYLGNGQSLHKRTTIVPIGRGPFDSFGDGAVDALTLQGFKGATDWSIERTCYRLEGFNGYGYHGKGVASPYLYGGSMLYGPPQAKAGKYVRDHVFDPDFVDPQLGTLVVLKALCALDASIPFADPQVVQPAPIEADTHEDALAHGVLWAQQTLNALGADPALAEDGISGKATMGMVRRFQAENGLKETGLLDAMTLAELQQHLDRLHAPAASLTPAPTKHSLANDLLGVLQGIFG